MRLSILLRILKILACYQYLFVSIYLRQVGSAAMVKYEVFMNPVQLACFSLMISLLSACAIQPAAPLSTVSNALPGAADAATGGNRAWHACRFKIAWPDGADPDWAIDHLLAHAVLAPVIAQQASELPWWRFHRRAARDAAGHRFSFLFYADDDTAEKIFAQVQATAVLQELLTTRIVEELRLEVPDGGRFKRVDATSDPAWSVPVQRNWPSFIMGVSALWVGLIDDFVRAAPLPESATLGEKLAQYRSAEASITALWRNEGQHAFIHHLSAIFGYEPMLIKKEIQF